jgi:shikimate dehydrogenase
MHNAAFAQLGLDWVYVPFTVAPERVADAVAGVRALGLAGVNVTVPLKEHVPASLDALTERATRLQAVNTLFWDAQGRLCGDSTDGAGFLAGLAHDGVAVSAATRAVVLGAGGSARAVVDALVAAGAHVTVANRTLARAEALCQRFGARAAVALIPDALRPYLESATLLVNTTSVGMHPKDDALPEIPLDALHADLFVSDLIYNPAQTRLLAAARARGGRGQNGVEMLVRQGALAFTRWTGRDAPVDTMRAAVHGFLGLTGAIADQSR